MVQFSTHTNNGGENAERLIENWKKGYGQRDGVHSKETAEDGVWKAGARLLFVHGFLSGVLGMPERPG